MKRAKLVLALVVGQALYAAATVGSVSGAPAAGATAAQSFGSVCGLGAVVSRAREHAARA
jgi:hypothetical protein